MIDLKIGQPDLRLLPRAELLQAAEHRLAIPDTTNLQYGTIRGSGPLREKLASFLTDGHRSEVDPERLFITFGVSHGLDLILSRYTREGDTVFIEDPTYFHVLEILRGRRLRIVPVPMDEQGLDVDAMESLLQRERPKLLYTIPIHHNPTGVTLSPERRARVAELARRHGFLIAADEVYQQLTYEGEPPPPMQSLDPERVLSLGSFSKILAPGLRLGWIDAAPEHVAELGRCGVLRSGGGPALAGAIVESALETGILSAYLAGIREAYRRRAHTMIRTLEEELSPAIRFQRPTGGFFVWLRLPEGTEAEALLPLAEQAGTGFLPGPRASVGGGLSDRLRLCFTYFDEEEIRSAVRRLAKVLN